MLTLPRSVLIIPVVFLAACSSTGTSTTDPVILDFDDYAAIGDAIDDASEFLGFTAPATLPTSGSATYIGVMAITADPGTPDEISVAGAMELVTLFATSDINGSVSNIVDDNNGRYQGSLTIDNGFIDRGADIALEYTFDADLRGNLTDPQGDALSVDAFIAGDLLGDGSFTEGDVGGFATGPGGVSVLGGGFIGERTASTN